MANANCKLCQMQHCCFFDVSLAVRRSRVELQRILDAVATANMSLSDELRDVVWRFLVIHLGWPKHESELELSNVLKDLFVSVLGLAMLDLHAGHSVFISDCPLASEIAAYIVWPGGNNEGDVNYSTCKFFHQTVSYLMSGAKQRVPVKYNSAKTVLCSAVTPCSTEYDRILVSGNVEERDISVMRSLLTSRGRLVVGLGSDSVMLVDRADDSFTHQSISGPYLDLSLEIEAVMQQSSSPYSLRILSMRRLVIDADFFGQQFCYCGDEDCLFQPSLDIKELYSTWQQLMDGAVSADVRLVINFIEKLLCCLKKILDMSMRTCLSGRRSSPWQRRMIIRYRSGYICRTVRLKQRELPNINAYFYFDLWNMEISAANRELHRHGLVEALRQKPHPNVAVAEAESWGITQDLTVLGARLVSDAWAMRTILISSESSKLGCSASLWAARLDSFCSRVKSAAGQNDLSWQKLCFHGQWLREMRSVKPMHDVNHSFFIGFEVLYHCIYHLSRFLLHLPQHDMRDSPDTAESTVDSQLFLRELARLDAQVPDRIDSGSDAIDFLATRVMEDATFLMAYLEMEHKSEAVREAASNPSKFLRSILHHIIGPEIDVDCLLNEIDASAVFE